MSDPRMTAVEIAGQLFALRMALLVRDNVTVLGARVSEMMDGSWLVEADTSEGKRTGVGPTVADAVVDCGRRAGSLN